MAQYRDGATFVRARRRQGRHGRVQRRLGRARTPAAAGRDRRPGGLGRRASTADRLPWPRTPRSRRCAAVSAACSPTSSPGDAVVVACSGGADSWRSRRPPSSRATSAALRVVGVTVDHGLQDGSAEQAARVVAQWPRWASTSRSTCPGRRSTATARARGGRPRRAVRRARRARRAAGAARRPAGPHAGRPGRDGAARPGPRLRRAGAGRDAPRASTTTTGRCSTCPATTRSPPARSWASTSGTTRTTRTPPSPGCACAAPCCRCWRKSLGPGVAAALARTADQLRDDVDALDALARTAPTTSPAPQPTATVSRSARSTTLPAVASRVLAAGRPRAPALGRRRALPRRTSPGSADARRAAPPIAAARCSSPGHVTAVPRTEDRCVPADPLCGGLTPMDAATSRTTSSRCSSPRSRSTTGSASWPSEIETRLRGQGPPDRRRPARRGDGDGRPGARASTGTSRWTGWRSRRTARAPSPPAWSASSRTSTPTSPAATSLIVDEIIDTGLTLSWLTSNLGSRGPASVEICTLLRKPEALQMPVDVEVRRLGHPERVRGRLRPRLPGAIPQPARHRHPRPTRVFVAHRTSGSSLDQGLTLAFCPTSGLRQ